MKTNYGLLFTLITYALLTINPAIGTGKAKPVAKTTTKATAKVISIEKKQTIKPPAAKKEPAKPITKPAAKPAPKPVVSKPAAPATKKTTQPQAPQGPAKKVEAPAKHKPEEKKQPVTTSKPAAPVQTALQPGDRMTRERNVRGSEEIKTLLTSVTGGVIGTQIQQALPQNPGAVPITSAAPVVAPVAIPVQGAAASSTAAEAEAARAKETADRKAAADKIRQNSGTERNFLKGKDYSYQDVIGQDFINADLSGANFEYAKIRSSAFDGANLTGANMSYVSTDIPTNPEGYSGPSFIGANLTNVNFSNATLVNSDFTDALINCADFSHANLENTFFEKAFTEVGHDFIVDKDTRLKVFPEDKNAEFENRRGKGPDIKCRTS